MKLLFIWTSFTICIGYSKLNNFSYMIVSLIMLFITKLYNTVTPINIPLRQIILWSSVPNAIFWALAYKCNEFLWVFPYNWTVFISIFCIYSYILMYIAIECDSSKPLKFLKKLFHKVSILNGT
jgi:hypothetical protein